MQGLTVTVDEEGRVLVARIIYGSFIERQGLLRPGDVVLEANGQRITSPEQVSPELMKAITRAGDRRSSYHQSQLGNPGAHKSELQLKLLAMLCCSEGHWSSFCQRGTMSSGAHQNKLKHLILGCPTVLEALNVRTGAQWWSCRQHYLT